VAKGEILKIIMLLSWTINLLRILTQRLKRAMSRLDSKRTDLRSMTDSLMNCSLMTGKRKIRSRLLKMRTIGC
jgi:hypothetical protein